MSEYQPARFETKFLGVNEKTLETYENTVQEYINRSPQEVEGDFKDWIDRTLEGLPLNARILEIGSAFGRDAKYIQALGYSVECTDATKGFVDLLRSDGLEARELNVITDTIDESYDMVLAVAVLLHFDRRQAIDALRNIYNGLVDGGRLALTVKLGEGEGWSNEKLGAPRYFCYWQKEEFVELLNYIGFRVNEVETNEVASSVIWLRIIANKGIF